MEKIIEDIKFMLHRFDKIVLELNHEIEFKNYKKFPVQFSVSIEDSSDFETIDDNIRIIDIRCCISNETFDHGTSPIFLDVTISGLFLMPDSTNDNSYDSKLTLILYAHLRSFICMLTSQLGYNESITLPIVDIDSFIMNSNHKVNITDEIIDIN